MLRIKRSLRLFALTAFSVTTMVAAGPAVSTASAGVSVEGNSEIVLEGWYELWLDGQYSGWHCPKVTLEGALGSDGEVAIYTVETEGVSGAEMYACAQLNDYQESGWEGQVVGPGDADYKNNHDFEALVYPEFYAWGGFTFPGPMRFGINGDPGAQEWSYDRSVIYEGDEFNPVMEIEGEFELTSGPAPEVSLVE